MHVVFGALNISRRFSAPPRTLALNRQGDLQQQALQKNRPRQLIGHVAAVGSLFAHGCHCSRKPSTQIHDEAFPRIGCRAGVEHCKRLLYLAFVCLPREDVIGLAVVLDLLALPPAGAGELLSLVAAARQLQQHGLRDLGVAALCFGLRLLRQPSQVLQFFCCLSFRWPFWRQGTR